MSLGTGLIILFSDPMVDVLSNVGARTGVAPFYIAFVLAPLASNTSELIASLNYSKKKTRKTITIALSTLEGAACMNNTFCLAIFMGARASPHGKPACVPSHAHHQLEEASAGARNPSERGGAAPLKWPALARACKRKSQTTATRGVHARGLLHSNMTHPHV